MSVSGESFPHAGLLVSVRSSQEALTALHPRVGIVDVKEPRRGSLGAADRSTLLEITKVVGRQRTLSIALGELRELHVASLAGLPPSVGYAKFGLAGCDDWPEWPSKWKQAWERLPDQTRRVAVYYADRGEAKCPTWEEVLHHSRRVACEVLLVDTYRKSGGDLWSWITREELRKLRNATRAHGIQLALAGSLTAARLAGLPQIQPDWIAVRTAVCAGNRAGEISRAALEHFAAAMVAAGFREHRTDLPPAQADV